MWGGGTTNLPGSYNVAIGDSSMKITRGGNYNVSIGHAAGGSNGNRNIAIGAYSGLNGNVASNHNISIGDSAFTAPFTAPAVHNINIGYKAGTSVAIENYCIYIGDSVGYNDPGGGDHNIAIGLGQDIDVSQGSYGYSMNIGGAIFGINMTGGNTINPATGNSTGRSPAGNIGIAASPNANYALAVGTQGAVNNSGSTAWSLPSDRRIKTDIETFTDGLNVITKLKPVTYRYNEKSGYSSADQQKKHIGFIAQDVEEVAPYMVKAIDDSKGASKLSDKRVLDVSALNQVLVNAVQEQQQQIEKQQAEIDVLKQELEELKKAINK